MAKHKKFGKMDRRYKRLWIKLLRSRRYTQANGALRSPCDYILDETQRYSHCCLGVLCDAYDPSRWDGQTYRYSKSSEDQGELPTPLRRKLKITEKAQSYLIAMNDGNDDLDGERVAQRGFLAIANWIEKNL